MPELDIENGHLHGFEAFDHWARCNYQAWSHPWDCAAYANLSREDRVKFIAASLLRQHLVMVENLMRPLQQASKPPGVKESIPKENRPLGPQETSVCT